MKILQFTNRAVVNIGRGLSTLKRKFKDLWNKMDPSVRVIMKIAGLVVVIVSFYSGIITVRNHLEGQQATKSDIRDSEERILNAIREQSIGISSDISRDINSSSVWERESYIPAEPSEETKRKAQTLLENLEVLRKRKGELPLSVELDEGIALIAKGEYQKGNEKIDDYLDRMDQAWKKAEAQRNEELFLAYKSKGDANNFQLNFTDALDWYNRALELKPLEKGVINSAGLVYLGLGMYDEGQNYFIKAIEIEIKNGNEGSADYTKYLTHIGLAHSMKAEFDKALDAYYEALEIRTILFGEKDISTILVNIYIGDVFEKIGEYDKALKIYTSALKVIKKDMGNLNIYTGYLYEGIGRVLRCKGDYDNALLNFEIAHNIFNELLTPNHPVIALLLNNIGAALADKGEYDLAIEHYQKALPILIDVHGEFHPDVASVYNNIGVALAGKKAFYATLFYYNKALIIGIKKFGDEYSNNALICSNIALLYYKTGKPEKGLPYIIKAFKISIKTLGPNHHYTKELRRGIELSGGDPEEVERELREEETGPNNGEK